MKRTITALTAVAMLGFGASGALASSLNSTLGLQDPDRLEDVDFEFVFTLDAQGNPVPFAGTLSGAVAAGQRVFLGGISLFESLNNTNLSNAQSSSSLPEVTGLFLTEVVGTQFANNGLDGVAGTADDRVHVQAAATGLAMLTSVFNIDASVQALLDPNTVALLFEDSTPDFNIANPTQADAENGNFILSASLQSGDFFAATAVDDIAFVGGLGSQDSIGVFGFGLTIDNFLFGTLSGQVNFGDGAFIGNPFASLGTSHDLVSQGGNLSGSNAPGFQVTSDVDVLFQAIPVPATVGFLGLGLLGLGAIARRRRATE